MRSTTLAWDEALTAIEAELDRIELLLVEGPLDGLTDVLSGMTPAAVSGAIPLALTDRAAKVRARTDDLVAAVAERLAETGRSLRAGGEATRRHPVRRVPAYLDARA